MKNITLIFQSVLLKMHFISQILSSLSNESSLENQ